MYFVRYGDICVRFTGKTWDERELPEFTSVYDYDDEKKYSLETMLKCVKARIDQMIGGKK